METRFTNLLEPDARSRPVFGFHRPETLAGLLEADLRSAGSGLRNRLRIMPPLARDGLWEHQYRVIANLEQSLASNRPRALNYDLRTNKHFTLKTNTLTRADLDDFVHNYNPANRHERVETERFRRLSYEDFLKRDKANLDIFWLRDESLGDSSDLPDPAVLAAEIVEDLQAALDQFAQIASDLAAPERGRGEPEA